MRIDNTSSPATTSPSTTPSQASTVDYRATSADRKEPAAIKTLTGKSLKLYFKGTESMSEVANIIKSQLKINPDKQIKLVVGGKTVIFDEGQFHQLKAEGKKVVLARDLAELNVTSQRDGFHSLELTVVI
ncbi:hypothetical protein [Hydrogenophaga sp.]|uniref:hypothetical protein n=1 Tax=Hydrogenophaga sp. TaxID=1904254 RepID=UPI0027290ED1|nr:hypothetical protein [Hydrogenophaga sp.]MDO9434659.1 hypothetical protein [Hydrogenophaga sp.]